MEENITLAKVKSVTDEYFQRGDNPLNFFSGYDVAFTRKHIDYSFQLSLCSAFRQLSVLNNILNSNVIFPGLPRVLRLDSNSKEDQNFLRAKNNNTRPEPKHGGTRDQFWTNVRLLEEYPIHPVDSMENNTTNSILLLNRQMEGGYEILQLGSRDSIDEYPSTIDLFAENSDRSEAIADEVATSSSIPRRSMPCEMCEIPSLEREEPLARSVSEMSERNLPEVENSPIQSSVGYTFSTPSRRRNRRRASGGRTYVANTWTVGNITNDSSASVVRSASAPSGSFTPVANQRSLLHRRSALWGGPYLTPAPGFEDSGVENNELYHHPGFVSDYERIVRSGEELPRDVYKFFNPDLHDDGDDFDDMFSDEEVQHVTSYGTIITRRASHLSITPASAG